MSIQRCTKRSIASVLAPAGCATSPVMDIITCCLRGNCRSPRPEAKCGEMAMSKGIKQAPSMFGGSLTPYLREIQQFLILARRRISTRKTMARARRCKRNAAARRQPSPSRGQDDSVLSRPYGAGQRVRQALRRLARANASDRGASAGKTAPVGASGETQPVGSVETRRAATHPTPSLAAQSTRSTPARPSPGPRPPRGEPAAPALTRPSAGAHFVRLSPMRRERRASLASSSEATRSYCDAVLEH